MQDCSALRLRTCSWQLKRSNSFEFDRRDCQASVQMFDLREVTENMKIIENLIDFPELV